MKKLRKGEWNKIVDLPKDKFIIDWLAVYGLPKINPKKVLTSPGRYVRLNHWKCQYIDGEE